jgi:1,2-diacylglycerol 3-alpha-glucosyltransferase
LAAYAILKTKIMRIGIFTDTYRPSVNGIVYVTEILRHGLEALGHEVYIFAPGDGIRVGKHPDDPHLIQFPAIQRLPSEEMSTTFLYPPAVLKKIEEHNLDMLHFLSPGPVGLMAVYAGEKLHKPVVAEYCTDLFEYVDRYQLSFPSIIVMCLALPFTFNASRDERLEMLRGWRPRRTLSGWNREMVKNHITVLHEQCDAVIVHSQKSADQLRSWQNDESGYDVTILPTGVDALPSASNEAIEAFRRQWNIAPDDEVVVSISRLGREKNLAMLVDMTTELIKWRPQAKLMFVGDADYRDELEALAKASPAAERIVFAGKIPREQLAVVHAVAKVFVFPSLTDTQSLAVHEAAQSGLPIVMIDKPVTEVVHDGENGFFSDNDPIAMAGKVRQILEDPVLHKRMSKASKRYAAEFSELGQCKKIVELYERIIQDRSANHQA